MFLIEGIVGEITANSTVFPEAPLVFDSSKLGGVQRKALDLTKLHSLGWKHRIPLHEGFEAPYQWFLGEDPQASQGQASERTV